MKTLYWSFDTETTGLDERVDQILSLAWILLDEDLNEISRKQYFAFPDDHVVVSPEAAAINGYTRELWEERGAVTQAELAVLIARDWKYHELFGAKPLGHNTPFDIKFLDELARTYPALKAARKRALHYHMVDTLALMPSLDAAHRIRGMKYGLGILCARWGIPLANAHDSMADIEATVALYRCLVAVLSTATMPVAAAPVPAGTAERADAAASIRAKLAARRLPPSDT
jgi:DNA polymerase III alpha subunit (gram-positive type)